MAYRNEALVYPVLRGGVLVSNPANQNEAGTLGCLLTDGHQQWLLSCYHVLGRHNGATAINGEPIVQGLTGTATVALLDTAHSDPVLDVAVAAVQPGIKTDASILHIGKLTGVEAPQLGMKVIKCGADTGVTEGIITAIQNGVVTIARDKTVPASYRISGGGDSGALWVNLATRAGVVLHQRGDDVRAFGLPLVDVLSSLHLQLS